MDVVGEIDSAATQDFWTGWLALAAFMFALVNIRLLRVPNVNPTTTGAFRRDRLVWIGKYVMLNAVVVCIVGGTTAFAFLNGLKYARFMRKFAKHFWHHLLPLSAIESERYRLLFRISLQLAAFAALTYPLTDIAVTKDSTKLTSFVVRFIPDTIVFSYAAYAVASLTFVIVHYTITTMLSMV